MGMITELFFNKEAPNRMARDLPLIWLAISATSITQYFITNNKFDFGYIFLVLFISLLIILALFLIYALAVMYWKK